MDVTPDKQNIDQLFSSTKYHIDFYQRQYKWDVDPVKRLLEDIFYRFNIEYEINKDKSGDTGKIIGKYSWYYMNTYVTNIVDGNTYVVDGQQRLTTLTLILIKLKHMAIKYESQHYDWISNRIVGHSEHGKTFRMNHEHSQHILSKLFDNNEFETEKSYNSITDSNLEKNYLLISKWLDDELTDKHKFETFIFYVLKRIVLINLQVEQTDVPMVFEVINDRGVRLKSYEILKGKLLGQIEKEELNDLKYNELWDEQINKINEDKDDEIDNFFVYYLRSKYANTINEAKKFEKNYHRAMFSTEMNGKLNLNHNPVAVKQFIDNEFLYYTNLYSKIRKYAKTLTQGYESVYYNKLVDMDNQYLLILSACRLNDDQEDEKIRVIADETNRLFALLQLQRSYNSNDFNEMVYLISKEIRGKDLHVFRSIFDEFILKSISENRGTKAESYFDYGLFRDVGIELDKRFRRYFFARVEEFIARNTNLNMKHHFYDLVVNTGSVTGFHIEHILANNEENLVLFKNDEELFERERNRLGGLLLLKGKDNISSNNEPYSEKLKTYANTLYWNETLREDSYKSKIDFNNMRNKFHLTFRPMNEFGPDELDERQKLLYEIAKIIWQ